MAIELHAARFGANNNRVVACISRDQVNWCQGEINASQIKVITWYYSKESGQIQRASTGIPNNCHNVTQ